MRLLQPRPPRKIFHKLTNSVQGMKQSVLRHERKKCCCFEFSCAAYPYFVRNLLFHPLNAIGKFEKNFPEWPWLE